MSINTSFLSRSELKEIGFKEIGENVLISRFARFYNIKNSSIGNNVRIDDFCILSGNIVLKDFIHISAYCALYGKGGIFMHSFTGLSPRTTVFSQSDDFSGEYLIGPMVHEKYTNVTSGKVEIGEFSQVGANSIIMPNVNIEDGVAVGALSLVNKSLSSWGVYAGIPASFIKERKKDLIKLKEDFFNK